MGAIFMKLGLAPTMFNTFMVESHSIMVNLVIGVMFLASQLSGPAASLPQIVKPAFKASAPIKPGKKGEVTVSFGLLNGYAINHTPPMTLKLTKVSGITLAKTDFSTPTADPKSKDEYYVD